MPGSDDEAVLQRLSAVPLFSPLSRGQLKTIARTGVVRSFGAGERVLKKGEKGLGFYLVLDGQVEVSAEGKALAKLGPGEYFGEMALFEEQPRSADVAATSPTRCVVLSRWEFWGALSKEPEVLRQLMAQVVQRLRGTSNALRE